MTPVEIERWFWSAREKLVAHRALNEAWWPDTTGAGNAGVTPLAYLFFIEVAASRCVGRKLTLAANAANQSAERGVIDAHWLGPRRTHSEHEVLVDFSVHNWNAASPIQLTGEAECSPYWGTGDSLQAPDDYSWDFYKLLVVPSATRLFFARIGMSGGRSISQRIKELVVTLQGLIDWYAPALLRPADELACVLVPTRRVFAGETRILNLERGRLREVKATAPDILE